MIILEIEQLRCYEQMRNPPLFQMNKIEKSIQSDNDAKSRN